MIEKNIQLFKERDIFFNNIKTNCSELFIENSKTGLPTAKYNNLYLHSKYDPIKEAKKTALEYKKSDLFVFAGFGLGYLVEEIANIFPESYIVVFEPNKELFYAALSCRDYTSLVKNKNIRFILENSAEEIKRVLIPRYIKKVTYIPLSNRTKNNDEVFNPISHIIKLYLDRLNINKNTLNKFGKLWVKNQIKNLPLLGYKNDISDIFYQFKDIPGIIVSAGPSMELIIPYLKEVKDKFLILAVDTALKSLLKEGIEPDIVMSIDSQFWNAKHLEGIKTNKTILVADSSIQSSALRSFDNRVYFIHSTFPMGKFFESHRMQFPKIASGGSVSTNIWDFAQKLGLSSTYFIGQDLGYPGNITHYKNSYFELNMLNSSTRLNSLETQSFKYIYNGFPHKVVSNSGSTILSDKRMSIYVDWFKEKLSLLKINNNFTFSPNSCKIVGLKYVPLKTIDKFPDARDKINKILKKLIKTEPNYYIKTILNAAKLLRNDLLNILELSNRGYKYCKIIELEIFNNINISNYLDMLSKIDTNILNYSHSQTLSFIIEPYINEITEIEALTPIKALKESKKLYSELINTSNLHIKYLNISIKKIENSIKINN